MAAYRDAAQRLPDSAPAHLGLAVELLQAGDPDAGRFVAPRFVATAFGTKPDETYAALKKLPAVVHWLEVSTAAAAGRPATVEEEGSRDEQAPAAR